MGQKPKRGHGDILSIPNEFYQLHHYMTLSADVMFINGVTFLTTLSREIKLQTVEHIQTRTVTLLSSSLTKVINMHVRVLMDQEFAN